MAKDAGFLDKRIDELRGSVRDLVAQLNATGDIELLKGIKGGNRELGQLERLRKQLTDLAGSAGEAGVKAGAAAAGGFLKSAALNLAGGKAVLTGGLVAAAAAAAPLVGGVISAAVLGGVGAGGIIGGVALAAQDGRVQDVAQKLGGHISAAFTRAAEPFVAPAIEAMGLLRGVVDDVSSDMRQAFTTVAPVLLPLTRGIAGLVDQSMPGFIKAMESAKPVLRAVGNELPKIGSAISDFFSSIAEDPEDAVIAFATLSKIMQETIRTSGKAIASLADFFHSIVDTSLGIARFFAEIYDWNPVLGPFFDGQVKRIEEIKGSLAGASNASGDFAGSLDGLAGSASEAEQEILQLKDAMDKAFGKVMDIEQATIAYEKSWDDTIETLRDGKRTLDATTEAGRENRGAILDNIEAIKGIRDANIASGMAVADANAIYDQQIEKLRKAALQAGFNKDQVNALINAFDTLPRDVELELRVKGLKGVIEQVKALAKLLGSKAAASAAIDGDYVSGRASGGPVMAGQTYIVGENGPEVLQMGATGGTVYNADQTKAMMSGASGVAAAPIQVAVQLQWRPGMSEIERAMFNSLQATATVVGGGSIANAVDRVGGGPL